MVPFRITDAVSDVAAALCQRLVEPMADRDLSDKILLFLVDQPVFVFPYPVRGQGAFLSVTLKFRKNIAGRRVGKGISGNAVINIFVVRFFV